VFVTYLTGALYVHPLWFYKYQHDNRFRSKLFVACQRWWFQWRFWFVPSVPSSPSGEIYNYCTPHIIKENFENVLIHRCNYILLSQMYCVRQVVKTPTIISNNPVLCCMSDQSLLPACICQLIYAVAFYVMLQVRTRLQCNMVVAVRGRKAWVRGRYFILVSHGFFIQSCSAGDKKCSERWSWLISVGCHNDTYNRDVNPNMPQVHAVIKTTG
jgi:hypothetical protein